MEKRMLYSWMGGFIDGEGTITICTVAKTKSYVPKIAVSNTDKQSIDIFVKEFGGKVRLKVWKKHKNWKPCYEWSLTYNKALATIEKLQPYLKIKNKQAFIVLKLKNIERYNGATLRWNPSLKASIHKKMQKLKNQVQLLNKRGIE